MARDIRTRTMWSSYRFILNILVRLTTDFSQSAACLAATVAASRSNGLCATDAARHASLAMSFGFGGREVALVPERLNGFIGCNRYFSLLYFRLRCSGGFDALDTDHLDDRFCLEFGDCTLFYRKEARRVLY